MIIKDVGRLLETPDFEEVELFPYPGSRQFFYESVSWHGKPTKVFACCGFPETASPAHPVPGVVLVHGGSATALADWVGLWNRRGYAAISMDTCGCHPCWAPNPYNHRWPRHEFAGPPGWGHFEAAMEPPEEQWIYHALAAVILGHSLLRSFKTVDAERIGVTGISWGGVLSLLAAAHDPRFRFTIPVYGCGYINTPDSFLPYANPATTDEQRKCWSELFDPAQSLNRITVPGFFLSGTNDAAFPFDSFWKSVRGVAGPMLQLMYPAYPHDHTISWQEETVWRFADAVLHGDVLPTLSAAQREGRSLLAQVQMPGTIKQAELYWTCGSGSWPGRTWEHVAAAVDTDGTVTAMLPRNFRVGYFTVTEQNGASFSTFPYAADGEF